MKSALTYSYDVSDQAYVRVRDFRNVILVSTALVTVLMFASSGGTAPEHRPVLLHTRTDDRLERRRQCCGHRVSQREVRTLPDGRSAHRRPGAARRSPVGRILHPEHPRYVPPLRNPDRIVPAEGAERRSDGGSSDPSCWVENFIPGLSELDSQRQILAYALVFGYAQQIATRLLDQRAQGILESVPSKEPEAAGSRPSAGSENVTTAGARGGEATGDAASLPGPSPAAETSRRSPERKQTSPATR